MGRGDTEESEKLLGSRELRVWRQGKSRWIKTCLSDGSPGLRLLREQREKAKALSLRPWVVPCTHRTSLKSKYIYKVRRSTRMHNSEAQRQSWVKGTNIHMIIEIRTQEGGGRVQLVKALVTKTVLHSKREPTPTGTSGYAHKYTACKWCADIHTSKTSFT